MQVPDALAAAAMCAALMLAVHAAADAVGRRWLRRHLPPAALSELGQYAVGVLHVQVVVAMRIALAYAAGPPGGAPWRALVRLGHEFSVTFFAFDSLCLLIRQLTPTSKAYLAHHAVAALIGTVSLSAFDDPTAIVDYMFYVELSNVALSVWDFARRHRRISSDTAPASDASGEPPASTTAPTTALARLHAAATPWLAVTYVPLRTLHLSVASARLLRATRLAYAPLVWPAVLFVQLLSYHFARRIAGIAARAAQRPGAGVLRMLLPAADDTVARLCRWPVVVYVAKTFVSLHCLVHVVPAAMHAAPARVVSPPLVGTALWVLAVDAAHIAASLAYNVYGFAPWTQHLDYLAINAKIWLGGVALLRGALRHHPHSHPHGQPSSADSLCPPWAHALVMAHGAALLCLAALTVRKLLQRPTPQPAPPQPPRHPVLDNRAIGAVAYALPFVAACAPPLAVWLRTRRAQSAGPDAAAAAAAAMLYAAGGIVWALELPERLTKLPERLTSRPPKQSPTSPTNPAPRLAELFNSVGWLHLLVTAADLLLLRSLLAP